jgi:hypothetical protein
MYRYRMISVQVETAGKLMTGIIDIIQYIMSENWSGLVRARRTDSEGWDTDA